MSLDGGRGTGKRPNYVLAPAPAFKYRVGRKAETELYDQCHLAWRAGLISSWYFGRRSPQDPTIVWEINGAELPAENIARTLESARWDAGVHAVAWGSWWCGYHGLIVTFSDGRVVTQSWDQGVREDVA